MKKQVLFTSLTMLLIVLSLQMYAQVGINTDGSQPDPSAMLDVKSAIKGFLPPRVALTSLNSAAPVASPVAVGLLIFNTASAGIAPYNVVPGYYYWNGARWIAVTTPQGANPGEMLYWNGSAWVTIPSGVHGQQLYFCNGLPTWGGCIPIVTTASVTSITYGNAVSGGDVTSDGGSAVTERGVCWSMSPNPTVDGNKTLDGTGTGVFISKVNGLTASTTYFLRAYATNGNGTAYGNEFSFETGDYSGAPVTTIPVLAACPGVTVDFPVTVAGFINIGDVTLTLHYNSAVLNFSGATNTSGFPGLAFNGSVPGEVTVDGTAPAGVNFPDNTVLFTLHFFYSGGSTDLTCFDNGESCQFLDGNLNVLNDLPTSTYYINGRVNEIPVVESPVFTAGPTSSRCEGQASVAYPATAGNSTGMTYSLDAASLAAGNSINQNTGVVNYTATWAGTSMITATATGCGGPKTSVHTVTVNPLLPVTVSVTASSNPVCVGNAVTFSALVSNGGASPTFQWKVNGTGAGANTATFTYTPVNGDVVTCTVTSNAPCVSGNPATSAAVTMIVNPSATVSVIVIPSANPVCAGTSVTFNASAIHGGSAPSYQWKVNGVNSGTNTATYSYIPVNNDAIACVVTSNETCVAGNPATSNSISMVVNALLPVSVSISASSNPVCTGTSVTFSAVAVNGGSSPSYQWKVNGGNVGGNTTTYSYVPANNDVITCLVTSNETCVSGNPATSNALTMVVNPLQPVSVSVSASSNPVCAGTQVTFTAVAVNGGSAPLFQWKVNGTNSGTNSATYTYVPLNNDLVSCFMISNASCISGNPAASNVVTMSVNPLLPVSVSISVSSNPVCAGTPATFTATAVNGGVSPAYQWMVNGSITGTGTTNFTYNPANNDVVTCKLTSSATCVNGNPATSNAISMTVNPIVPVSVTVSASANPVCGGTQVTFTATGLNGGPAPAYQWKVNGTITGTNSTQFTYVPSNNDLVKCIFTSNGTCLSGNPATSNELLMTVSPQLAPGSIGENQTICMNTLPAPLHSLPPSNGTSPVYQWQSSLDNNTFNNISGATTLNYQPGVLTGTTHYRQLQNATGPCGGPLPTNVVTITVNPLAPAGVSISANPSGALCYGTTVNYTAVPVNGGLTQVYQWKVNGNNAGINSSTFTYVPLNGDVVTCKMTSDLSCASNNPATSNALAMVVNTNPDLPVGVSVTANPSGSVCPGTEVEYTAAPLNGGTAPTYQWHVNGVNAGSNNAEFSYEPVSGDVVGCTLTSNATCVSGNPASSNTITVAISPALPVSVSIVATAVTVCPGTSATLTATPVNGGTNPIYQWKVNGINTELGSSIYTYIPANGDIVTCSLTSSESCVSGNPAISNAVTLTVQPYAQASISISASENPFCVGSPVTYTSIRVAGGTYPSYQWQVNGSNVGTNSPTLTYNPSNNDIVTCIMTSSRVCVTGSPATSNAITMAANAALPVSIGIAASANPVCPGSSVTYTATPVNGGTNPSYQWKVNGINSGTGTATFSYAPANGDVVTCVLTSSGTCVSGNPATSNSVTMTHIVPSPVSVSITSNPSGAVCQGTSVTFTASGVNGGSSPTYQWKVNGINVGANSPTYSYAPANADVVTCLLTSNLSCTSGNPATSNLITTAVNPSLVVGVTIVASANPVVPSTSVTFTATPVNGGTSPSYQWKVNGTNVGSNSATYAYVPVNNDHVICVLTSSVTTCVSGNPASSNTIIMSVINGVPCPGLPTVDYGGKTYNTVYIGTQCWLRENLNIGTRIENNVSQANNGIIEKYCYNNLESNCDIYGGLYQWTELMQYVTTAGAQGICPTGWHVPTDAEFAALSTQLGGDVVSAGKMKETGFAHFLTPNTGATNETGFTALPCGYSVMPAAFGNITKYGYFFTSTQNLSTTAWYRTVAYSAGNFGRLENYKTTSNAVRCLKN